MLHDLANNNGYVALRWVAEYRGMETQRKDVKILLYSRRRLMIRVFNAAAAHTGRSMVAM